MWEHEPESDADDVDTPVLRLSAHPGGVLFLPRSSLYSKCYYRGVENRESLFISETFYCFIPVISYDIINAKTLGG